jgi:ketosteroid isomerase-like protein
MKTKILIFSLLSIVSFTLSAQNEKDIIDDLLNNWHQAAANADQQSYFDFIADDGIYIGTDATENWIKDEFFEWSKSYFENGKAWSFVAKERNIYLSGKKNIAWFDEQLEYPGGVLRGSGVLAKIKNEWKLKHYVLSLPVPNDKFKDVIEVINPKTRKEEMKKEE